VRIGSFSFVIMKYAPVEVLPVGRLVPKETKAQVVLTLRGSTVRPGESLLLRSMIT
jgi:hypothetical protein